MNKQALFNRSIARLGTLVTGRDIPLSFEYDGVVYRGLPEDTCGTEITRRLIDSNMVEAVAIGHVASLEIRVTCTEYRDFPALEWYAEITNRGSENSAQLKAVSMVDACFAGEDPVLLHSNGDDCSYDGYQMFRDSVDETGITMKTKDGTPCAGTFPFMRLMFRGHGVNFAVGWPGAWKGTLSRTAEGVSVRFCQETLDMYLYPGETIRTPRVLVMGYEGDEAAGRNQWRAFYRTHMLPKDGGKPLVPMMVLNNPGGGIEFTKASEQNQVEGIAYYGEKGFSGDIWWLDAGWYPCDLNWVLTGTWKPDPERFSRGLGPVGEACDRAGMRFLLWFELERVTEGSAFDREHPDWLLYLKEENGNISWTRMMDLSNDACLQWAIDHVDKLIKESHVKIYRQDFNLHPVDTFWLQKDLPGRAGSTENHYIQNLLLFWDTLVLRNPGLLIDNCSSGGRRNDYELMRRSIPLHYTDVGYGVHPEKQQQYRMMHEWIPYFRSSATNWDLPDGTFNGATSPFERVYLDKMAAYTAFAPAFNPHIRVDSTEEELAIAREMIPIWRRAAELMPVSDYYPLCESHKSETEYYACQFDDLVTGKGFIQVIRNTRVEEEAITLTPHAEAGQMYRFTCMDPVAEMVISGDALQKGFTVTIPKRSSVVWFYEKL